MFSRLPYRFVPVYTLFQDMRWTRPSKTFYSKLFEFIANDE